MFPCCLLNVPSVPPPSNMPPSPPMHTIRPPPPTIFSWASHELGSSGYLIVLTLTSWRLPLPCSGTRQDGFCADVLMHVLVCLGFACIVQPPKRAFRSGQDCFFFLAGGLKTRPVQPPSVCPQQPSVVSEWLPSAWSLFVPECGADCRIAQ